MKSAVPILSLGLAILSPCLALAGQTPRVLEPKVERRDGPPLWISAEAVADPEEIIQLDRIDDANVRRSVAEQRRAWGERLPFKAGEKPAISLLSPSQCKSDTLSAELRGGNHPSATLADLATHSRSILRGKIRSLEPGFASGEPALLVGIDVAEALKGSVPASPIYVSYPVARFKIGPFQFCNAEKGYEPGAGDEVLLFDYLGPIDRDRVLYAPRLDQLFFQSQSGQLFLPPRLRGTAELGSAQTLDDVAERLRAAGIAVDSQDGAR